MERREEVQSISGTTAKRRYTIMWENGRESEVTNNAICLPEDLRLLERKKRKRKKNWPPRTAQSDGAVDVHDHLRQGSLAMEKEWLTHNL